MQTVQRRVHVQQSGVCSLCLDEQQEKLKFKKKENWSFSSSAAFAKWPWHSGKGNVWKHEKA